MPDHLRIFFVTNNYTPYSGGVVSSIQAFATEIKNKGHDVFIITLDFLGATHNDPDYVFRVPCPLKFLYKNNHMAYPFRPYHHIRKLVHKLKPHIIHSHHPFLLGNTAVNIAEAYAIPVVFTHHSLYERWTHMVPLPAAMTAPCIKACVKRYCGKVSGIIAPSGMVKSSLMQQGVTRPIEVIPSGLQDQFAPAGMYKEKKSFAHRTCELLSVSRFSPEKNIPFLLDLIAELSKKNRDYRLTLVGYGPLWNDMQHYAYDKLKLSSDNVRFIHRPVKESLIKLYQDADLFIFSSQSDTQGLVLAEAMAGGTPILALDGAGQRDIIEQGKNGFISYDMDSMIDCIEHIVSNEKKLHTLSSHAWQTAKRYKIENVTDHLIEFYNQFV